MIEQFINFVIRPPRAEYNPDLYLWEEEFTLAGRKYQRQDLELQNGRGHTLKCSHYVPLPFPENTSLPCVIYCHGNSGCRADANEAAVMLLPSNITVFTLDFSGSGLSGGDYVSLGWHERDDLKVVVNYLRSNQRTSCIGLWGRSMGAVTCLLYGADDPSIAGIVLDSAFSNLFDLMMELVDVYKIRLPKFTVKMALQYMRRVILRRAKFDIMDLNCAQVAPNSFIPALFGHATEDAFIQPHHTDLIFKSYAGDKNFIRFEGDHNSPRPQFYYDSVSIFFYNVLQPPQIKSTRLNSLEKYYDLGSLKVEEGVNEALLYEIITGVGAVGSNAASSSAAPPCVPKVKAVTALPTKSVAELIAETGGLTNGLDSYLDGVGALDQNKGSEAQHLEGKVKGQNEECCSYSSSNRESWGRCSSLGGSDEESSSAEGQRTNNRRHQVSLSPSSPCVVEPPWSYKLWEITENGFSTMQMSLKALATPLRRIQCKTAKSPKETKSSPVMKKSKREKFEKLEALGRRFRLCILKRVKHKRHLSS